MEVLVRLTNVVCGKSRCLRTVARFSGILRKCDGTAKRDHAHRAGTVARLAVVSNIYGAEVSFFWLAAGCWLLMAAWAALRAADGWLLAADSSAPRLKRGAEQSPLAPSGLAKVARFARSG